jgi:hypothetical protein
METVTIFLTDTASYAKTLLQLSIRRLKRRDKITKVLTLVEMLPRISSISSQHHWLSLEVISSNLLRRSWTEVEDSP